MQDRCRLPHRTMLVHPFYSVADLAALSSSIIRRSLAQALIDDSAGWARGRGAAMLEIVIAPNGLDVSHPDRYYRVRGFEDDGRRLLAMPLTG
jgi:hypothetical protein